MDAGGRQGCQRRLECRLGHAGLLGLPVRRPQPILESRRIHPPHFPTVVHWNDGHRVAVGVVYQLAMFSPQGNQLIDDGRIISAAGQGLAYQFVEQGDRGILVHALGALPQPQVGRHVGRM